MSLSFADIALWVLVGVCSLASVLFLIRRKRGSKKDRRD